MYEIYLLSSVPYNKHTGGYTSTGLHPKVKGRLAPIKQGLREIFISYLFILIFGPNINLWAFRGMNKLYNELLRTKPYSGVPTSYSKRVNNKYGENTRSTTNSTN